MNKPGAQRAEPTVTALLLTGGLSTRMGQDKARLVVEGQPLWARQLALLRRVGPKALWVSARQTPDWVPSDTEVLLDAAPSLGPLSGIAPALARIRTTHLLVLAVDLPNMTVAQLTRLIDMAETGCGVIPATDEHLEPLVAVYPKEAASFAQAALAGGQLAMHSFAQRLLREGLLREYRLSQQEAALYLNLNTPSDLPSQS